MSDEGRSERVISGVDSSWREVRSDYEVNGEEEDDGGQASGAMALLPYTH